MNSSNDNKEFEEMRAQLALLHEKLDKQMIVNDGLIRSAMRSSASDTVTLMRVVGVVGIVAVVGCPTVFYYIMGMPIAFALYTALMLAIIMGMHLYSMYIMPRPGDMSDDLSRVETKIERFVKVKRIRILVGICMLVVMMGWIVAALPHGDERETLLLSSFIGCLIGLLIAALILTRIRRNTRRMREGIASLKEEKRSER